MASPGGLPRVGGLFASLRRLLDTLLEIAQGRLELLQIDLEREKLRIYDGLLCGALALVALAAGVVMLAALLVLVAPPPWRPLVLGVLTLACLGGGAWLLRQSRTRLSSSDGIFAATRGELARDRAAAATPSALAPGSPAAE